MPFGNVSERLQQPPDVGVSVVILALGAPENEESRDASGDSKDRTGRLWLPLVRRVRQPFLGDWALPGGGLQCGISLEQAAFGALESTTDMHPRYLEQLYTFGDPKRSSGGLPMVSIVYWALVGSAEIRTCTEGENVQWFPADELPALAFDHRGIIEYALWRLRNKIEYSTIAARFVGERFTLAQLRSVHEAVLGRSLDPANFRRHILGSGELEDTGTTVIQGRSRPASVYRYRRAETTSPLFSPSVNLAHARADGSRVSQSAMTNAHNKGVS